MVKFTISVMLNSKTISKKMMYSQICRRSKILLLILVIVLKRYNSLKTNLDIPIRPDRDHKMRDDLTRRQILVTHVLENYWHLPSGVVLKGKS